jgi:hypothetical protein
MADTGVNASFKFGATTYDSDDCLSGWNLNDAIQEIVYQCGGVERAAAGPRVATFSISMGLDATDTAKVIALYPGAEGAFEAHPAGDTATYIEITATDGLITQANKSAPQNGIITLDLTIRLQDITIGTATT